MEALTRQHLWLKSHGFALKWSPRLLTAPGAPGSLHGHQPARALVNCGADHPAAVTPRHCAGLWLTASCMWRA
jgi:hypothetical protein